MYESLHRAGGPGIEQLGVLYSHVFILTYIYRIVDWNSIGDYVTVRYKPGRGICLHSLVFVFVSLKKV